MIKYLVCLLALLSASPSSARPDIVGGLLPPRQFDHPFKGRLVIVPAQMESFILGWTYGQTAESGICTVYINWNLKGKDRDLIIRHEVGHCNGWPGNHYPHGRR